MSRGPTSTAPAVAGTEVLAKDESLPAAPATPPPYGRRATDKPGAPQTAGQGRRVEERAAARENTIRVDTARLDQVLNLSGKMLGLYFSFDDRGRLWWMKAEYPYSRTDSGKTAALLQALKERCQAPVARSHPDVELVLDEARMRMTMVSKPLRDEYRARVPEEQRR